MPGYTGGHLENPTYEQVSIGNTGHAEAIKIEFDPAVISFEDLLTVFFFTHDPTSLNRQGNDYGTQYRSAVFFLDDSQKNVTEDFIKDLNSSRAYDKPIVTTVQKFDEFYEAEDYHKNYYASHKNQPYCSLIIAPKLEKLQEKFANLLKG